MGERRGWLGNEGEGGIAVRTTTIAASMRSSLRKFLLTAISMPFCSALKMACLTCWKSAVALPSSIQGAWPRTDR